MTVACLFEWRSSTPLIRADRVAVNIPFANLVVIPAPRKEDERIFKVCKTRVGPLIEEWIASLLLDEIIARRLLASYLVDAPKTLHLFVHIQVRPDLHCAEIHITDT